MTNLSSHESVLELWLKNRKTLYKALLEPMAHGGYLGAFQNEKTERVWGRELFDLSREPTGMDLKGGASGLGHMEKIASTVHGVQQRALRALNQEGAWISDYSAYLTRMTHDADQIRTTGFDEWRRFVDPRLADVSFGTENREAILRVVWSALIAGEHLHDRDLSYLLDRPAVFGEASDEWLARSCSLHFRDGDAWLDYQKRFGRGKLWQQVAQTLNRAARQHALLAVFGTRPEQEFLDHIEWISEDYKENNPVIVAELRKNLPQLRTEFYKITMDSVWPDDDLDRMIASPLYRRMWRKR